LKAVTVRGVEDIASQISVIFETQYAATEKDPVTQVVQRH